MGDDMEWKLTTKDLGEKLGVEAVTIRKYALALEKAGHSVNRDANDNRVYSEQDAMVFQQLKTIRERSGLTVEKSAEVVVAKLREASVSVSPAVIEAENTNLARYDERYNEIAGQLVEVLKVNRALGERLERMEERQLHQNENLTIILREMLEVKQAIVAAKENRSLWDRIRGR